MWKINNLWQLLSPPTLLTLACLLCKLIYLHGFRYYLTANNSEISVFSPGTVTKQCISLSLLDIFAWMTQRHLHFSLSQTESIFSLKSISPDSPGQYRHHHHSSAHSGDLSFTFWIPYPPSLCCLLCHQILLPKYLLNLSAPLLFLLLLSEPLGI